MKCHILLMCRIPQILLLLTFGTIAEKSFSLQGNIESEGLVYFNKTENMSPGNINGEIAVTLKPNKNYSIYSCIKMEQLFVKRNSTFFEMNELYCDVFTKTLDFRIGKQEICWGKVDFNSPSDNLSSWDYSDFLDTENKRKGVFGLSATAFVGKTSLQAVILPFNHYSFMPEPGSVWSRLTEVSSDIRISDSILATIPINYRENYPQNIITDFKNISFALKVGAALNYGDINFSLYHGNSTYPEINAEREFSKDAGVVDVKINYYHKLKDVLSFDLTIARGTFCIRSEAGIVFDHGYKGYNKRIRDIYMDRVFEDIFFRYVIQPEFDLGQIFGFFDKSTFSVLWTHDVPLKDKTYSFENPEHMFDKSIGLLLSVKKEPFLTFDLRGISHIQKVGYYFQPKIAISPFDGISIVFLVDILGGEKDNFFGFYQKNTRMHLKFKTYF